MLWFLSITPENIRKSLVYGGFQGGVEKGYIPMSPELLLK